MGTQRTRREFLGNVGRGMLVASVGFGTAFDMGLSPGPRVGEILRQVYDRQLDGEISTLEEGLAYAASLLA